MSEPARPLLSVLIPVWNAEPYLVQAIRSVLDQEWAPIEVIVVDDASTDRSGAVAEGWGPPVQCLRQPHAGVAAARNAALAAATGEFVAYLDADDLLTPGSIAVQMAAFDNDPLLEIVIGHVESFFSPELTEAERARFRLPDRPQRGHLSGASIVRARVFRRVGPFDTTWRIGAEIDWFMRATEAGVRMRILSDVVYRRRIHGRNTTLTMKEHAGDRLRILKASLARRRAAAREPLP